MRLLESEIKKHRTIPSSRLPLAFNAAPHAPDGVQCGCVCVCNATARKVVFNQAHKGISASGGGQRTGKTSTRWQA